VRRSPVCSFPTPFIAEREGCGDTWLASLGARIWDVDGNEYIDYLMMAGPIILDHNYPPLIERVIEVVQGEGIGSGWPTEWEIRSSELIIRHMKNVEMVRFL
jgi:glutamate-1-semialdehyde 2,1-aminomutase